MHLRVNGLMRVCVWACRCTCVRPAAASSVWSVTSSSTTRCTAAPAAFTVAALHEAGTKPAGLHHLSRLLLLFTDGEDLIGGMLHTCSCGPFRETRVKGSDFMAGSYGIIVFDQQTRATVSLLETGLSQDS